MSLDVSPVMFCLQKFSPLCDLWFPESSILHSFCHMARNLVPIFILAATKIARYMQACEAALSTLIFCIFHCLDRHACMQGEWHAKIRVILPKAKELLEQGLRSGADPSLELSEGTKALLTPCFWTSTLQDCKQWTCVLLKPLSLWYLFQKP